VTHKQAPNSPAPREFHRLFVEHQRQVFAYILSLLPKLSDAEEVFQDVSVILLNKEAQFEPGTNFLAWACQIARLEVYNYRRQLKRHGMVLSDALVETLAEEKLTLADESASRSDALRACLEQLSARDRDLIQQRYAQKTTSKQLAADLGRPANTVYKALGRIRDALFECVERKLKQEGGNP
jgi:RNA polymerase sigma-70 factor (ECF subfamily)